MKTMILVWIYVFSAEHNLDPVLVEAIVKTESSYDHMAVGGIGEIGLMQMRKEYLDRPSDYFNPELNLKEGIKRLSELKHLQEELGPFWFTAWNLGATGALRFHRSKGIIKAPYTKRVLKNYYLIKQEMKKDLGNIRHSMAHVKKSDFPLVVAVHDERQK